MRRSLAASYLLWVLGGLLGAHRFYLGSYFLGFLYLLTGGLFGIGWVADAFLIPGKVDEMNRRLEAGYARQLAPARMMLSGDSMFSAPRHSPRESASERDERRELAILDAARKGDGSVTAAEAALAAHMSVASADEFLTDQARKGFCDIDNRDSGAVCYRYFS